MKRPSPLVLVLLLGFVVFSLLTFSAGLGLGYSWGWRQAQSAATALAAQGEAAAIEAPGVALATPSATMPQAAGPQVTAPQLRGPEVTGSGITGPQVRGPEVTPPRVTGPSASARDLPAITLSPPPAQASEKIPSAEAAPEVTQAENAAEETPAPAPAETAGEQDPAAEDVIAQDAIAETEAPESFQLTTGVVAAPLRLYPLAAADPTESEEAAPTVSEAAQVAEVQRFARQEQTGDGTSFFAVEVALHSNRQNAADLAERLAAQGGSALVVQQARGRGQEGRGEAGLDWFSVTLGRYATRAEAERLRERVRRDEDMAGRVVLVTPEAVEES